MPYHYRGDPPQQRDIRSPADVDRLLGIDELKQAAINHGNAWRISGKYILTENPWLIDLLRCVYPADGSGVKRKTKLEKPLTDPNAYVSIKVRQGVNVIGFNVNRNGEWTSDSPEPGKAKGTLLPVENAMKIVAERMQAELRGGKPEEAPKRATHPSPRAKGRPWNM